jgi:predicted  nucleic acid-binding Zn-ribbon protein
MDVPTAGALIAGGVVVLAVMGVGVQQLVRIVRGRNGKNGNPLAKAIEDLRGAIDQATKIAELKGAIEQISERLGAQRNTLDALIGTITENAATEREARHALANQIQNTLLKLDERVRVNEQAIAALQEITKRGRR